MFLPYLLTEMTAWRCPACGRITLFPPDTKWVVCFGGWILVQPAPAIPWHEMIRCHQIDSESITDPLELARAARLVP